MTITKTPPPTPPCPRAGAVSPQRSTALSGKHQVTGAPAAARRSLTTGMNHRAKRLLDRVLNVATPRGVRTEAKLTQRMADTRQDVRGLLERIANPGKDPEADFLDAKEAIAQLNRTMQQMTSRGADGKQVFDDSVKANLREMSTDMILALHEGIAKQSKVTLYEKPELQTASQREGISDRRHFVAIALRDIEAQVRIELDRRIQFDGALKRPENARQVAKAAEVVATIGKSEKALAVEIAEAARAGIHKGANASLLSPLRKDLPPAPARPEKAASPSSVTGKLAPTTPDRDARLTTRAKKLGSTPLAKTETNAAASSAAGKLLYLLANPGGNPDADISDAKLKYTAMHSTMRRATIPGSSTQRAFCASVMVSLRGMTLGDILKLNDNIIDLGGKNHYVFMADAFADIRMQINAELKHRVGRGEALVHSEKVDAAIEVYSDIEARAAHS